MSRGGLCENVVPRFMLANPNKASAGIFSGGSHVLAAFFQRETKTQFVLVPYRGSAPAVQDLAAGQIDLSFISPQYLSQVRALSIKAYAVTSEARLAVAPDIPTFGEIGLPALSFPAWFGLFAPKDTPTDVIDKLNAAGRDALTDPAARSRLTNFGYGSNYRESKRDSKGVKTAGSLICAQLGSLTAAK